MEWRSCTRSPACQPHWPGYHINKATHRRHPPQRQRSTEQHCCPPTHSRPHPQPTPTQATRQAGADDNSVAQREGVHEAARPLDRNASTHWNAGGALCQKYGSQQVNDERQQQVKANISVAFRLVYATSTAASKQLARMRTAVSTNAPWGRTLQRPQTRDRHQKGTAPATNWKRVERCRLLQRSECVIVVQCGPRPSQARLQRRSAAAGLATQRCRQAHTAALAAAQLVCQHQQLHLLTPPSLSGAQGST